MEHRVTIEHRLAACKRRYHVQLLRVMSPVVYQAFLDYQRRRYEHLESIGEDLRKVKRR